jgi:putative membrane protein
MWSSTSRLESRRPGPRIAALVAIAVGAVIACASPGLTYAHVLVPGEPASSVLGWTFEPWVVILLLLALGLYLAGYVRLSRRASGRGTSAHAAGVQVRARQLWAYLGGWLALVVALVSPLDSLGAALFSAHMLQHELLMIVAAPLLVLGRPLGVYIWAFPNAARRAIGRTVHARAVAAAWRALTLPLAAWAFHAVALWAWHVPFLFQQALEHEGIHVLQHTTFLASALVFWWTALVQSNAGANNGHAMLSLFTTMVHTAALGALLTLAPALWYPDYVEPTTALGFSPLQDQQLGGLIMWVPGGVAYLLGGLAVASRWLLRRAVPLAGAARERRFP